VSGKMKEIVSNELKTRLEMNKPPIRSTVGENVDAPGYDAILSKFHNPFEVLDTFSRLGYMEVKLHWYHYHPAMPWLEAVDTVEFRSQSIAMEHESSGWRGYFLCSAFVVEAVKGSQ
jgi:hypothetical protein